MIGKLIRRLFGFKYLLNTRTMQIHRERAFNVNCSIGIIPDCNKEWMTKNKAKKLIMNGKADGCHWCWREENNCNY